MIRYRLLFLLVIGNLVEVNAQQTGSLSLNGFKYWQTGHDSATHQLIPASGGNALSLDGNKVIAHAKFSVMGYGELSFPLLPDSNFSEAPRVDLSESRFITIRYRSNVPLILQLRQTGVHGGVHNHVVLPPSRNYRKQKIYFTSFEGGLKPLDLSDVAKFNFAVLQNNAADGFAEFMIRSFIIDKFKPTETK